MTGRAVLAGHVGDDTHSLRRDELAHRGRSGWTGGAALILCLAAAMALRAHFLAISVIDWDESLYLVIAREWLAGGLPYVAVWDQHPAGLPALLAGAAWVTGDLVLGARLAATLAAGLTAFVLFRFCDDHLRRPWAGALAAGLYLLLISRLAGGAANTEIFNNLLVATAALLLLGAARRARDGRPAVAVAVGGALLLGLGLQIKYVVLPECAALCLGFLACARHAGWSGARCAGTAAALVVAGLLPTAAATLYFWANGAFAEYLAANVGANAAYVTMVPDAATIATRSFQGLKPMGAPVLLALLGLAVRALLPAGSRAPWRLPHVWLGVWIAAAACDVVLPLKFWPHYFHALLPPAAVAGALGVCALTRPLGRWRAPGFAVVAVLLLALPVRGWINEVAVASAMGQRDTPREIAAWLAMHGVRDGAVYVYNYEPVIYALAAIRPPSPFVIPTELSDFSASSGVDGGDEVTRILRARPRFIVVATEPPVHLPADTDRLVAARLHDYVLRHQWHDRDTTAGEVFVYERRDDADG